MATHSHSGRGEDLATAVGEYVLGDISLGKAAEVAGLSRWEFEEVLEEAGVTVRYGPTSQEALDEELEAVRNRD